jgi:hypothetical protein
MEDCSIKPNLSAVRDTKPKELLTLKVLGFINVLMLIEYYIWLDIASINGIDITVLVIVQFKTLIWMNPCPKTQEILLVMIPTSLGTVNCRKLPAS